MDKVAETAAVDIVLSLEVSVKIAHSLIAADLMGLKKVNK
jgi:hypothetical protein